MSDCGWWSPMSARNRMFPRQRTDEAIRIVAYDSRWPQRFAEERTLLEEAIGPWVAGGIHHVGSTAVPGLEAKPIIDILVAVRDLEESRVGYRTWKVPELT